MPHTHTNDDDTNLPEELRKATSSIITDESRETANKVLEEETKSTQSSEELLEGIKGLITEGNTLAARLLDCQGLSQKAGLPSRTQESLKALWDNFTKLLWNSKSIATSGQALADDFVINIMELLQDPDVSATQKVGELERWNASAEQRGEEAKQQPKAFESFVAKIREAKDDIENATTKNQTSAQKDLAELLAKISKLTKEIDGIAATIISPVSRFLQLGDEFLSLLITSPDTAFRVLLHAVSAGVKELLAFKPRLEAAKKKRRELEAERDQLRNRVRDLEVEQAKLGDASTLTASLESINEDTAAFSGRLSKLIDIFAKLSNVNAKVTKLLLERKITDQVLLSELALVKGLVRVDSYVLRVYGSTAITKT